MTDESLKSTIHLQVLGIVGVRSAESSLLTAETDSLLILMLNLTLMTKLDPPQELDLDEGDKSSP